MKKAVNFILLIAETGRRQMKRILMVGAALFALTQTAQATEAEIKSCLCQGMEQDVVLQGGAKADCASKKQVVKVSSTEEWADALGKALRYAAESDKSTKIILYCSQNSNNGSCRSETRRLESTIAKFSLPIGLDSVSESEVIAQCGVNASREERDKGSARLIPIW